MKSLKNFLSSFTVVAVMLMSVFGGYSLINALPVDAQVQIPDTCQGDCPLVGDDVPDDIDQNDLAGFIIGVAQFLTFIVIALSTLFLVYGGFLFVTDNGDGKRAGQGKTILTNAIIGLVLSIVAFTIVQVIANIVNSDVASGIVS